MKITLSQAMGSPQDVGPIILKSTLVGSLTALFYAVLFTREAVSLCALAWSIGMGAIGGTVVGIAVVILLALIKRAESS